MTNEYVVQMLPMVAIAGALVAWLAQIPKTNRGYGFLADMSFGLGGCVGGGALFAGVSSGADMIVMFWVGIVGAIVALVAQRRLWGAAVAHA